MMLRIEFLIVILLILGSVCDSNIVGSEPSLKPCEIMTVLPVIKTGVSHLIPEYNREQFMIELEQETLRPTDPNFSDFLLRYYKLTKNGLFRYKINDERIRNAMLTTFNILYLKFLQHYGIRLSCLSYYTGSSNFPSVSNLIILTSQLQKRLRMGSEEFSGKFPIWDSTQKDLGKYLIFQLGVSAQPYECSETGIHIGNPICDIIFIQLNDGQILTKLPTLIGPPFSINIPGDVFGLFDTRITNATYLLSRYLSDGLSCLESNILKKNFSLTLSDWISDKLIPQLLGTSYCAKEFPGVLVFLKSIEMYGNNLRVIYETPPPKAPVIPYSNPNQEEPVIVIYNGDKYTDQNQDLNNFPVLSDEKAPVHQAQVQYFQQQQAPPPNPDYRRRDPPPFENVPPPLLQNLPQPYLSNENYEDSHEYGYAPDFQSQPLKRPKPDFDSYSTMITTTQQENEGIHLSEGAFGSIVFIFMIIGICCCGLIYFCISDEITVDEIKERLRKLVKPFHGHPTQPNFFEDCTRLLGDPKEFTQELELMSNVSENHYIPSNENYQSHPEYTNNNMSNSKTLDLSSRGKICKPYHKSRRTERQVRFKINEDPSIQFSFMEEEDEDSNSDEKGFSEDLHIITKSSSKPKSKHHPIYSTSSLNSSESRTVSEDDSNVVFERYIGKPKVDLTPSGQQNVRRAQRLSFNNAAAAAGRKTNKKLKEPAPGNVKRKSPTEHYHTKHSSFDNSGISAVTNSMRPAITNKKVEESVSPNVQTNRSEKYYTTQRSSINSSAGSAVTNPARLESNRKMEEPSSGNVQKRKSSAAEYYDKQHPSFNGVAQSATKSLTGTVTNEKVEEPESQNVKKNSSAEYFHTHMRKWED